MTPYARHYRRPTYRIQGQRLETSQVITLPVKAIRDAQEGGPGKPKTGKKHKVRKDANYDELKALPPGLPK